MELNYSQGALMGYGVKLQKKLFNLVHVVEFNLVKHIHFAGIRLLCVFRDFWI